MKKKSGYLDYKDYIKTQETEFNQMQIYLIRLNNIMDRRDVSYEEGFTLNFYRSTMNLYSNVVAKLELEKVEKLDEFIKDLKALGNTLRTTLTTVTNERVKEQNMLTAEQKLLDLNTRLNRLIMSSGLIFPKSEIKTVSELRKKDYGD